MATINSSRPPLFLADSDDEDQNNGEGSPKPNFFSDDDDDDMDMDVPPEPQKRPRDEIQIDEDDEVEETLPSMMKHRSSSYSVSGNSVGSPLEIEVLDDLEVEEEPMNTRPTALPRRPPSSSPPAKKRRLSPVSSIPKPLSPPAKATGGKPPPAMYLGETIIAEAWATCSGKGLLQSGDAIHVHLELVDIKLKASKDVTKKDAGKQMKLTSMLKKAPPKAFKKQGDDAQIVRFSNSRHQEVGRLPSKSSSWIAKLLDKNAIRIEGTVIDCPAKLSTGCHIMLSLRFYFVPNAFINPSASMMFSSSRGKDWDLMPEGAETSHEKAITDRKTSLVGLFEALSLRPIRRKGPPDVDAALAFTKEKKSDGSIPKGKGKVTATEVIGEGEEAEEVEVEGEELTGNQLTVIYKKAQLNDREMPEMDPVDTFTLTLRPYQRQALRWMHSIENGTRDARDAHSMHPLWEEYAFCPEPRDGVIDLCEDDDLFYFNPYSGELSLEFPTAEINCRGGILADVGMGKSIMMSSLIHTNATLNDTADSGSDSKPTKRKPQSTLTFKSWGNTALASRKPSATLLVAPLSLLAQWKAELDRSSKKGTIRTYIYHGTSRTDLEALIESDDDEELVVVITSYGTLSSEHNKTVRGGTSSFYDVEWLRVVLDEAHYIKSRHTKTAKACYALRAWRRWCLTGTPIVNRLEDLHSLLHFLRDEPWSDFAFFKSAITTPFLKQDPRCLDVVQIVLESILLRREKTMTDRNGKPIVSLPPKEVTTEKLEFSTAERKIYDSIFADVKHAYDTFTERGVVGKNMSNILAMLMRLRRAVLHPSLIQRKRVENDDDDDEVVEASDAMDIDALIARFTSSAQKDDEDSKVFAVDVLKDLKSVESQECPLCLDTMQDPVLIPECHHAGCKECIVDHLQDQEEKGNEGFCPVCQRRSVTERSLIEVTIRRRPKNDNTDASSSPDITLRTNDFVSSTKLDALIRHLRQLREREPTFRAIVFSQFTGFLDLIRTALQREGFDEFRLDGSLGQKQRTQVLQDFAEPSGKPKVFGISLKAGGVGLNLTHANHVFMMDSWWNSAVEQQAIDRVHRIGQDKTVHVTHFVISRTIEERIIAIQKRKTAIVKSALGGKGKSDPETFENLKIMFAA